MMNLYNKIISWEEKISVIGLGYVGLPIAAAFAKKVNVVGYDINKEKIDLYKKGIDITKEVGDEALRNISIEFTSDEKKIREAKFHIVAVPTPINFDKTPDLRAVIEASKTVGRNLANGSIVVYESTVYPGVTEELRIPILENESGMKCGKDFKVGYSPERINPGDKEHRLKSIVKVVSGIDEESADVIAKVYGLVVEAGIYKAQSIKVAEAAKVIENSQRDINIAFMNELSIIFNKLGIDTKDVLEAANTKWNFLDFKPGLVGGHCIGVDPYYLTYKAAQAGYHSQIILSGRRINDSMGKYVVENLIKKLIGANIFIKNAKVAVLGFTFKENCPDTRNTKVIDIVNELKEYCITPIIVDPIADIDEAEREHQVRLNSMDEVKEMDAVIIAVGHIEFLNYSVEDINKFYKHNSDNRKILFDVKAIYDKAAYESAGYIYWRL